MPITFLKHFTFSEVSGSVQTEKVVYYRAKQGQGYTLVNNTGDEWNYTTFHLNVPDRLNAELINFTSTAIGTFYLSIDYETSGFSILDNSLQYHFQMELSLPTVPITLNIIFWKSESPGFPLLHTFMSQTTEKEFSSKAEEKDPFMLAAVGHSIKVPTECTSFRLLILQNAMLALFFSTKQTK